MAGNDIGIVQGKQVHGGDSSLAAMLVLGKNNAGIYAIHIPLPACTLGQTVFCDPSLYGSRGKDVSVFLSHEEMEMHLDLAGAKLMEWDRIPELEGRQVMAWVQAYSGKIEQCTIEKAYETKA